MPRPFGEFPATPTLSFPPSVESSWPYTPERPAWVLLGFFVAASTPLFFAAVATTPNPPPVFFPPEHGLNELQLTTAMTCSIAAETCSARAGDSARPPIPMIV